MQRSTLARHRFQRTSAEGGGGGQQTDGQQQQQTGDQQQQQTDGQQQQTGPEMAKDEQGNDLGFPKNTAVAEMTEGQRAQYWRNEAKKQQKAREELERRIQQQSGTVSNQQGQQQQSGNDDAIRAARREGYRDAVLVSMSTSLQARGKTPEEITELLDVVNPDKFLDSDGKLDGTKVANYVARVAPASGNGTGALPGQGRQETAPVKNMQMGREEAKRRGYAQDNANRGALGGLRK